MIIRLMTNLHKDGKHVTKYDIFDDDLLVYCCKQLSQRACKKTFTRMGSMLPSMISLMVTYLYIVVNSSHKELAKNFHKDGTHVTKYDTLGEDLPAS